MTWAHRTWAGQDNLPFSGSPFTAVVSLLPCKVHIHRLRGWGTVVLLMTETECGGCGTSSEALWLSSFPSARLNWSESPGWVERRGQIARAQWGPDRCPALLSDTHCSLVVFKKLCLFSFKNNISHNYKTLSLKDYIC